MALTYAAPAVKVSIGARWLTVTKVTLDTKYPTGGYTLEASKLGMPDGLLDYATPTESIPSGGATAHATNIVEGTGKLQLYGQNKAEGEAQKEVASEADVHTESVTILAIGR